MEVRGASDWKALCVSQFGKELDLVQIDLVIRVEGLFQRLDFTAAHLASGRDEVDREFAKIRHRRVPM